MSPVRLEYIFVTYETIDKHVSDDNLNGHVAKVFGSSLTGKTFRGVESSRHRYGGRVIQIWVEDVV